MARRRKVGDLYAIPLPNGIYAFGRLKEEGDVSFYKHRGLDINDLPSDDEYEFTVTVFKDCFKEWLFIENRPFATPTEAAASKKKRKDIFTGEYSIYEHGIFTSATEDECSGLEVCAVWANIHLIKRLMYDDTWKQWFPNHY